MVSFRDFIERVLKFSDEHPSPNDFCTHGNPYGNACYVGFIEVPLGTVVAFAFTFVPSVALYVSTSLHFIPSGMTFGFGNYTLDSNQYYLGL